MKSLLPRPIAFALFSSFLALLSQAQEEPAPSVITTEIGQGLHLLQGKGGNVVASVGDQGILLIDDDYAEFAEAHHQALKSLTGDEALPRYVINTHWHFDHVGGNEYWGGRGSTIIAHENVYQRMSTRQEIKVFDLVLEPSPREALPVITYANSTTVRFNEHQIELQHLPGGHTDGDSVAFFVEANVVHMGDHYFKDRFPFVDIGSGGNVLKYTENVAEVLKRIDDDTIVVPGHGDLADRADLERYLEMLHSTSQFVRTKLEQGASLEEVLQQGLDEKWANWGQGFINEQAWITFIAGSL